MKKRILRQGLIREIVRKKRVKTQQEIVDILATRGYKSTQATISRDVEELRLSKSTGGYYVLAEDQHLQRMISDLVEKITRSDNLIIVQAQGGTAAGVAAAIDTAALDGVLGTVSGDTTLLCICDSAAQAAAVEEELLYYTGDTSKS